MFIMGGVDWHSCKHFGLWARESLVPTLSGSPFIVALIMSHFHSSVCIYLCMFLVAIKNSAEPMLIVKYGSITLKKNHYCYGYI